MTDHPSALPESHAAPAPALRLPCRFAPPPAATLDAPGPAPATPLTGLPREIAFWSLNFVFWAFITVCGMLTVEALRSSIGNPRLFVLQRCALAFLYSAALRWIFQHRSFHRKSSLKVWLRGFAACLAIAATEAVAAFALPSLDSLTAPELLRMQAARWVFLSFWTSIYFGLHLAEDHWKMQLAILQSDKARLASDLRRLEARINPHFLSNGLNAVVACRHNPDAVAEIAQSLADCLRFFFAEATGPIPLERELANLEKYLHIQNVRFGPLLHTQIDCDLDAGAIPVPPMIVQPLAENAFKHGTAPDHASREVTVRARLASQRLLITVSNTGCWIPPRKDHTGTGLATLQHRLASAYGPDAHLTAEECSGRVSLTLDLPLSGPLRHSATSQHAPDSARR